MTKSQFRGWVGHDEQSAHGKLVWEEFQVKPFEEHDIDLEITHSGICGSDLHVLSSNWGPTPYPVVVGHEVVGKVARVGKNVDHLAVGDRVGVGAQCLSCLKPGCHNCAQGDENHCPNDFVTTYGQKFKNGYTSQGGYATTWRGHSHFAIKIPETLPSAQAAPMLCGGVTTFAPLKRHGVGPGKTVGVIGIGGLGHFALLWARALGSQKIVAISRSRAKEQDARQLGADDFISTSKTNWESKYANKLDVIIETAGPRESSPYDGYLSLLRKDGVFIQVGNSGQPMPRIGVGPLIIKSIKITGSVIGSPGEITEMLELAATCNIRAWVETRPMREANSALVDFEQGKSRYRYCLVN